MKNGREKTFYILSLIDGRVKKPKTIKEMFLQFQKEMQQNKIPFSVFRYNVSVLINENRVESEKRKTEGSNGKTLFIKPKQKQTC